MWLPDNRNMYSEYNHPAMPYRFTDDVISQVTPFVTSMLVQDQYGDKMASGLAALANGMTPEQRAILAPLISKYAPGAADIPNGLDVLKKKQATPSPSQVVPVPGAPPMVPMQPQSPVAPSPANPFDIYKNPLQQQSNPIPREVSPTIQAAASGSASVPPPVKVSDLGTMGPLGDAITKLISGGKTPSLLEQTINDPTPMFGRDYLRGLKKDQDLADKTDTDQALRGLGIEMRGVQAQQQIAAREAQIQAMADRLQQTLAFRGQQGDLNRANQRAIAGGNQGTRLQVAGKSNQPTVLDVLSQLNTELSAAQKVVDQLGKAYGPRMAAKKADYNKAVAMRDQVQRNIEAVKKQSGLFIVP